MPIYELILIVRIELVTDKQVEALQQALSDLPASVTEVHVKSVKEA